MITLDKIDSGIDSGSSPELLHDEQPMSRTLQYRKVMKPLLERKRRARINKCLDDLKDLMVYALQSEGESITKLEKADVLELTVRHLRKLKRQNALALTPEATYAGRFKAGYTHCAQEVSKFLTQLSGLDVHVSTRLLSHLGSCIHSLEALPPSVVAGSPHGVAGSPQPTSPKLIPMTQLALRYNALFPALHSPTLAKPSPIKPDVQRLSPVKSEPMTDHHKAHVRHTSVLTASSWRPW